MSLKNKKLIFNSDDFGHSHPFNEGIYRGIKSGVLTTTNVLANMEGYMEAVAMKTDLIGTKFGVHLNLIEGKSITQGKLLGDSKNFFNNGYTAILRKSFDKNFMKEVEFEFRAQIERVLGDFEVDHINSHVHTHSIPNIFRLTAKLAEEYNIPYIRTQFEKPYLVPDIKKNFNSKLPVNFIKLALLNTLTLKNKKMLSGKFHTNNYLLGVTYTGFMDKKTVLSGLSKIEEGIVEILIHPAYYENKILKPYNYNEYLITQDTDILDEIKALGFIMCDCSLNEKLTRVMR